jgi:hypothetical protein
MCALPAHINSSTYNESIGLFPIFPNLGCPGNPDLGLLAYFPAEMAGPGAVISTSLYGADHNYVLAGAMSLIINAGSGVAASVAVRFE